MSRFMKIGVPFLLAISAAGACAQQTRADGIDLAVTYTAEHTEQANTTNGLWLQGGSLQLGAQFYRGLGIAADVTGMHTASIGGSGVPFSEVTAVFGPRYRWRDGRVSWYGEALVGEGSAFDSVLPGKGAAQTGTNSLALRIGGGLDYDLTQRIALRVLDAAWMRTQFANSTDNLQNDLRLSTGLVLRFR